VLGVVLGGGKGEFDIVRDNFFWCVGKIALFKEKKKDVLWTEKKKGSTWQEPYRNALQKSK